MIGLNRRYLCGAALAFAVSACTTVDRRTAVEQALYDTHAHLYSDDIKRYPIDTSAAGEGAAALRARILTDPARPEILLSLWRRHGVEGGAGVQYNSAYRTDNTYLLDSAAAYPDKISPVVILDARLPETPARLRELVEKRGVMGLRLTGTVDQGGAYPWLDSTDALRTWAEADRLGMVMVLMNLPRRPFQAVLQRVGELARRYPNVKIVLDHVGWLEGGQREDLGLTEAHLALRKYPNVYYKLTSINFDALEKDKVNSADVVRRLVDVYGADHLMWGSDYGNTPGTYPNMVRQARESTAKLTETEARQVLSETGRRLFSRK